MDPDRDDEAASLDDSELEAEARSLLESERRGRQRAAEAAEDRHPPADSGPSVETRSPARTVALLNACIFVFMVEVRFAPAKVHAARAGLGLTAERASAAQRRAGREQCVCVRG